MAAELSSSHKERYTQCIPPRMFFNSGGGGSVRWMLMQRRRRRGGGEVEEEGGGRGWRKRDRRTALELLVPRPFRLVSAPRRCIAQRCRGGRQHATRAVAESANAAPGATMRAH